MSLVTHICVTNPSISLIGPGGDLQNSVRPRWVLMPYNMIKLYFNLPYLMSQIRLYFLHSTSVLPFYINVVLSLSTRPFKVWWGTMIHSLVPDMTPCWGTTRRTSPAIAVTHRYRLTSAAFIIFFDGLVPCFLMSSLILVFVTVASWDTLINAQMPHFSRRRGGIAATKGGGGGGALRLPKSEGTFAEPVRWQMDTWYLLTLDRKVVTWGLVGRSSLFARFYVRNKILNSSSDRQSL